jgi:hypothetical protein
MQNESSDKSGGASNRNVLPNGGEIHFTDGREVKRADRVEFLPSGMVKAIYKKSYNLEVYPPHVIEGVYTFTEHLEDNEWW